MNYLNCRRCDSYSLRLFKITKVTLSDGTRRYIDPTEGDGYCVECAEKRIAELRRSDKKAAVRNRVKATKANAYNNDCMIVAATIATGASYDKVVSIARRHGWKPNSGRGPAMWECQSILQEAAALKGKRIEPVSLPDMGIMGQPTPADIARTLRAADKVVIVATKGREGHAMSYTDGKLNNADSAWSHLSNVALAWRIVK